MKMNEPVFAHTTKREPEIGIENNRELFDGLIAAALKQKKGAK